MSLAPGPLVLRILRGARIPAGALAAAWLLHTPLDAAEQATAACPPSPNCVSSRADPADARHHVPAFALKGDVDGAWARVRARACELARAAVVEDSPTELRLVVRSFVFRFPDDVALSLDRGARRVEVRSASRYGYSDLGVNRSRIEELRDMLRQEGIVE